MTKVFKSLCIAALAMGLAACKDDTNRVISDHVSPAGHPFTLMPITERGVTDITISAAWATDWIVDANKNEWVPGLASEMMISGGTERLSPAEVLELLEDKNSYGNIFSTSDVIYAEVEFPNNHRNAVVPVLAELFQKPNLNDAWFQRIKSQRLDFVTGQDKSVDYLMWEASRYAVFGKGPQTEFLNGTEVDALQSASLDEIRDWHAQSFAQRPLALVVTGAVDAEDAGKAIDELLPPPGKEPIGDLALQDMTFGDKTIYLHLPDAEKSTIGFLGPLPDTTDGKDGVDLIIAHLFGAGPSSPLFETIRAELGATYGMFTELSNYSRKQRVLVVGGEIDTSKMSEVRDAVQLAYKQFVEAPDLTLLEEISVRLSDSIRQEQVYVSSSAAMIRELLLDQRDPQEYQGFADSLTAIKEEDIMDRLLNAFPAPGTLSVFAAGPDPSAFPDACVITETAQAAQCWD